MSLFQAYLTRHRSMKPLTKIRIFRLRLAVVLLGLYWIAIFTGTHLPKIDFVNLGVGDKTKHFAAFFGLTLLLCYVSGRRPVFRRLTRIVVIVTAYAMIDEWTQGFVPGRTPDGYDFVADVLGMSTAIAVYFSLRHFFSDSLMRGLDAVAAKFSRPEVSREQRKLSVPPPTADR